MDEYRIRNVAKVTAGTLEALARKLEGVDAETFLDEVGRYNEAVRTDVPFDGSVKDGRGTEGLELPKSNWANTIDAPPFEAYHVGCGITFTFGGLRIDPKSAQVINDDLERSEEHTSELQSLMRISYAVFCLKQKKTQPTT